MDINLTSEAGSVAFTDRMNIDTQCKACTGFIMHSLVGGSICLLGLCGNSLTFIVLSRDKGTPVASIMLQALAVADNFFLCLWFLQFSLSEAVSYFSQRLPDPWLYIRLLSYPLLFVGQTATIWMTVLIASCRYIAVCKPYRAAKLCSLHVVKRGIVIVAVSSFIYNLPRYMETRITYDDHGNTTRLNLVRTAFGNNMVYKLLYFDVAYYVMCFILPLVLLAALNTKLTLSYRHILKRKRRLSIRSRNRVSGDNNITLVTILIILGFMVSNTPARIVQIIWRYKPQMCLSIPYILSESSNILEVLNSSINFLIYSVFRKEFRKILRHDICRKRIGR